MKILTAIRTGFMFLLSIGALSIYKYYSALEQSHIQKGGFRYGEESSGKKAIVSYSYSTDLDDGEPEGFLNHLFDLLHNVSSQYPGFEVHIYSDTDGIQSLMGTAESVGFGIENNVQKLLKHFDNLKIINVQAIHGLISTVYPRIWNLYPIGQSDVKLVLVRNINAILLEREVDVVNNWLEDPSSATLHVMRDHPEHSSPIVNGLWDIKIDNHNRQKLVNIRSKLLNRGKHCTNDYCVKDILTAFIWSNLGGTALAHDCFHCNFYTQTSPFPTERKQDFYIGQPYFSTTGLREECPIDCRPRQHKDWTFC